MKQVSIRTTKQLSQLSLARIININWLKSLTKDPNKSWAFFKRGLGIFCLGVVMILAGAKFSPLIQIPGLITLALGSLYAIRGYIGILAHRMTFSFKAPPSEFDKDK